MLQGVSITHTYTHTKTYIENSDPRKGHLGQVDRQMEETHESKQLLPTEQEEDRCETSKFPNPTRLTPGSCLGQTVSAGRPASRRDDRGCTYPGWPRTHTPFPTIGQENAFKQSTCTEHPTYPMNTHPELPALSTAALATFFFFLLVPEDRLFSAWRRHPVPSPTLLSGSGGDLQEISVLSLLNYFTSCKAHWVRLTLAKSLHYN